MPAEPSVRIRGIFEFQGRQTIEQLALVTGVRASNQPAGGRTTSLSVLNRLIRMPKFLLRAEEAEFRQGVHCGAGGHASRKVVLSGRHGVARCFDRPVGQTTGKRWALCNSPVEHTGTKQRLCVGDVVRIRRRAEQGSRLVKSRFYKRVPAKFRTTYSPRATEPY